MEEWEFCAIERIQTRRIGKDRYYRWIAKQATPTGETVVAQSPEYVETIVYPFTSLAFGMLGRRYFDILVELSRMAEEARIGAYDHLIKQLSAAGWEPATFDKFGSIPVMKRRIRSS